MNDTLVIRSATDLANAKMRNTWFGRRRLREVRIEADGITDTDACRIANQIRRMFNVCGCVTATLCFLCAFGILGIYFELMSAFAWLNLAATFLLAVVLGMLAKLTALTISYWRLNRILESLRIHYPVAQTELVK